MGNWLFTTYFSDHEVVEFFILGEVRRGPEKLLPWISRGPTLKYSGHW